MVTLAFQINEEVKLEGILLKCTEEIMYRTDREIRSEEIATRGLESITGIAEIVHLLQIQ